MVGMKASNKNRTPWEQTITMRSGESSEKSSSAGSTPPERDLDDSEALELRNQLETARRSILEEIRNYPRPIAGCDQQFNYLLEERDRILGELSRFASIGGGSGAS